MIENFRASTLRIASVALCASLFLAPASQADPTEIVYASPDGVDLKAYVFSPPADEPRPAIVLFHGGGWSLGEAAWAFSRARFFADHGLVAVAVQYRLSDREKITPLEAMSDARAAIKHLRQDAEKLGIDPYQIAGYGWSAGAHLAASAAIFNDGDPEAAPNLLILDSPAVAIAEDEWPQTLLGDRAEAHSISPAEHVRAGLPPTLILQGDVDTVTPLAGSQKFCDRMRAAGNLCEMKVYKGYGHLFTPAEIDDGGWPQPDPKTRADSLAESIRFLRDFDFLPLLEPDAPSLRRMSFSSEIDGDRDAYVYLPKGYSTQPERDWPVLFFLHGNGERGDGRGDLPWVLVHGPLYEAWIQKRDLPFIIVAPQLPFFGFDQTVDYIRDRDPQTIPQRLSEGVPPRPEEFATPEPMRGAKAARKPSFGPEGLPMGWMEREDELLKILDLAQEIYRVDPKRVYLTGLSYGGFGTWQLASRHPQRFAAIAPVAGWGHPEWMPPLAEADVPIWAFAGGRDPVILTKDFYAGLNRLEELGHDDVRFTIHADPGHDVWRRVYASADLYDWLLTHRID